MHCNQCSLSTVLNGWLRKLPSAAAVLSLNFICLQSTDLLCGTFNLDSKYSCKYCREKAFLGWSSCCKNQQQQYCSSCKVCVLLPCKYSQSFCSRSDSRCCLDTHCQCRCACSFCTQSSALHSTHLRKRKPHLQFPATGLCMCLHVLLSPGHSSQCSWPTAGFLGLSETPHSEVPSAQRQLSRKNPKNHLQLS